MNLSKRMDKLEEAFITHLTESGEIRADLKWVKKAVWTLVGLGTTLGGVVTEEIIRHALSR
jgi:hypothetical protein